MNNLAYHHLLMSCTDKAFHYVQAAQNTDENKNTCMLWKELCHFYEDMSKHNQFALTMEFNACKMKNTSINPTLWYVELGHIHQQVQKAGAHKKFEAQMITQIMTQIVTEEYKVVLQAIWIMPMANQTLKQFSRCM